MNRRSDGHRRLASGMGIGVMIAIAGSFGIAVGVYSTPRPQEATVVADVYAQADQRAVARFDSWRERTYLSIEITRGGYASAEGVVSAYSRDVVTDHDEGTWVRVQYYSCPRHGPCSRFFADKRAEPGSFSFGPLMRTAVFTGTIKGCPMEVEWTGQGRLAPFAGRQQGNWSVGDDDAHYRSQDYAELSRVAVARIDACFGSFEAVDGYLSQGVRKLRAAGDVYNAP